MVLTAPKGDDPFWLLSHWLTHQRDLFRDHWQLKPGAIVTTPRHETDCVVTEYGVARIKGQSVRERAKRLIAIAHPDFRDELTFHARKLHLL